MPHDLSAPAFARSGVTRALARFAVRSCFASLPAKVQAEAARALLNWVGCALGGSQEPATHMALATVARLGGAPQASVLGHGVRTDVASAAFVNSISSSNHAFDDAHLPTVAHPSSPAGAAMLAIAQQRGLSGRELLHAMALAIEVQCRISNALVLPPAQCHPGFFVTGLSGPIGVAVGVAALLGLDEERMVAAIVLAASQASGFRATNGTVSGNLRPGHAARCGIWAALLAADGVSVKDDALEAPHGFFAVFAPGADLQPVVAGLGTEFALFANAYKPYPCGVVIHPALDACLDIRRQVAAEVPAVQVQLRVHPVALALCSLRAPVAARDAAVSLYHWAAAALVRGAAGLAEARQECIDDPQVARLRAQIEAVADPSLSSEQAIAQVAFANGQVLRSHTLQVRGSLALPLSDAVLDAKFRAQAEWVLAPAQAQALLEVCRGAASCGDIGREIAALATSRPA